MPAMHLLKRIVTKRPSSNLESVLSLIDDYVFDSRYRIDTITEVAIDELDIGESDKKHADKYKPTRARYFRKLMQNLDLPRDSVFVDVGCGKGRILLLAAEQGFEQVVGLEISPALCEIAEQNIAKYKLRTQATSAMKVVCTNILEYQFDGTENILFLYSPFDHPVTSRFLEMLRESIEEFPRDVHLIIDEFRFPELLESDNFFEKAFIYNYGAAVFHVYTHKHVSRKTVQAAS